MKKIKDCYERKYIYQNGLNKSDIFANKYKVVIYLNPKETRLSTNGIEYLRYFNQIKIQKSLSPIYRRVSSTLTSEK